MKGRELGACLSISKAAFTSTSPSAIWRCEGAVEQKAARWEFCVIKSSQVSVSAVEIVNTQINIVLGEDMNPD